MAIWKCVTIYYIWSVICFLQPEHGSPADFQSILCYSQCEARGYGHNRAAIWWRESKSPNHPDQCEGWEYEHNRAAIWWRESKSPNHADQCVGWAYGSNSTAISFILTNTNPAYPLVKRRVLTPGVDSRNNIWKEIGPGKSETLDQLSMAWGHHCIWESDVVYGNICVDDMMRSNVTTLKTSTATMKCQWFLNGP